MIDNASEVQGECRAELELCWAAAFTRTRNFLIAGTKVQNKMLPSKRFLDLVLFVNKYYLLIIRSFTNP